MCKLKISLLLLVLTSSVLSEDNKTEVKPQSENLIQSTETVLQTITTEEPSFFYRWTSWFNPFSRSSQDNIPDLVSEATHLQYAPQYLPPAQNNYQQQQQCNPCDQEPWIPIAGQSGRNTVIGFVKPSHFANQGYQAPPQQQAVQNAYAPPPQFGHPLNSYGAPAVTQALPEVQYGQPAKQHYNDQFGYATNNKPSLVLPPSDNSYRTLTNKFMPPPPQNGIGYNYHRLKATTPKFNYHKHNKPTLGHGPPIPLNFGKQNQNYAPQFSNNFQKVPNKLVPPSTSYGVPIQNDLHASNTRLNLYPQLPLNPPNDFHLNLAVPLPPIPFPSLSLTPVAPLHNYQPFHNVPDNYLQPTQNVQNPVAHDVQVVPSIQVANYLASIEHPINIIQSPLVELNASEDGEQIGASQTDDSVKSLLEKNPIVVEDDNNAAASVQNATYHNPEQNGKRHNDKDVGLPFLQQSINTPPPFEYNNWTPYKTLTTAINPPPVQDHSWFSSTLNEEQFVSTTKKPKQVQIIIPYTSQTNDFRENKKPISIFTVPPPQQEAIWTKYVDYNAQESNRVSSTTVGTEQPYSTVVNIKDFLLTEKQRNYKNLPFDVVRLQKNIDVWTEKEYSKNHVNIQKDSTVGKLVPSKNIPSEYLITQPYQEATTIRFANLIADAETADSINQLVKIENIDDNLIVSESTEVPTTTDEITTMVTTTSVPSSSIVPQKPILPLAAAKAMWEKLQVQVSPLTKEKIYVVTPQPWNFTPEEINQKLLRVAQYAKIPISSPKFSVIIQPDLNSKNKSKDVIKDVKNGLQVVYSEWPHLINNLLTSTTEESKPVTKHPLFGLMDISSYTPPPNSTVETYGGHSKVITVVTPSSVAKKKVKNDKLSKH